MKKSMIYLSIALLTIVLCGNISAQKYSKVKITLKNGIVVEGKKGVLAPDKINFLLGGAMKDYALEEVSIIMGKKSKVGAYALGFGGGCMAISLIAVVANPNDEDTGTLLAGAFLWAGVFAGIGAGIGALASPWRTIYVGSQHSSILNKLDLKFSSYQKAPYNIGITYNF